MCLAVVAPMKIRFFIIKDKECHKVAIINQIMEDLDMADLPALMEEVITKENPYLEAGGDS